MKKKVMYGCTVGKGLTRCPPGTLLLNGSVNTEEKILSKDEWKQLLNIGSVFVPHDLDVSHTVKLVQIENARSMSKALEESSEKYPKTGLTRVVLEAIRIEALRRRSEETVH